MAGEYCTSNCGHCGRCTDADEAPIAFYCAWCNDYSIADDFWPYCSSVCAIQAERDSIEDTEYECDR